jgi:hypothetical protein
MLAMIRPGEGAMTVKPYAITVRGPVPADLLSEVLADYPGLSLQTVLTGQVADQAQLHGLLRRLHDLGVEIVAFRQLAGAPPTAAPDRAPGTPGAVPTARDGA